MIHLLRFEDFTIMVDNCFYSCFNEPLSNDRIVADIKDILSK